MKEQNIKSLTSLQKAFLAIEKLQAKLDICQKAQSEPIAIIGMSCRFPGNSDSVEQYWQMLENQVDAVTTIPEHRWSHSNFYEPNGEKPGSTYVNEAAFLQQVDGFDAEFFSIPPREANSLDPQQRLLLELSYETLQHAGIASSRLNNTQTGVFIGIGQHDYLHLLRESVDNQGAELYLGTGNGFCFASGRLSYHLGLQGPSFSIDTACSSSLVALHQACLSLRVQECDLALTGGVQLMLSEDAFVLMSAAKALAKDGRCKSFSEAADGYGRGEGAGMIALKRLIDAQRDGDKVLAVIRGSAVDHDGRSSGLTVPNGRAQQILLRQLLKVSNTSADEVAYVETHGTGTSLGDPIEYGALAEVLRKQSNQPLLLGSVKTNFGHLEAAAGIAGLIKLILAIEKDQIPANLHFDKPNSAIPWQDYPLKVVEKVSAWPQPTKAKVGIVSSFGLSGTNAQVLLAEADTNITVDLAQLEGSYLFKLSAKSEPALQYWLQQHIDKLNDISPRQLADFCFSANISRDDYPWRFSTVAENVAQLHDILETALMQKQWQLIDKRGPSPVFMFAGQGSVKVAAGLTLFNTHSVFKASLLACDQVLAMQGQIKATTLLYGDQAEALLKHTEHEQIALFALQYALAKMYLSWGIKPTILLGHSVGEYAAACIAGVFDLDDAIKILCCRGRLMQALPENGGMVAVYTDQQQVQALLKTRESKLSIAAVNSTEQVVVSGESKALQDFIKLAEKQGLQTKCLSVNRGFHSAQVDTILAEFKDCLNQINFNKPQLRFVSTVTGQQEIEALSCVDYWLQHARQTVLFHQALNTAQQLAGNFFIEIGTRPILTSLSQQSAFTACCTLDAKGNDWYSSQKVVSALYQSGYQLDWLALYQGRRRLLMTLPNYPWQRKRYWYTASAAKRGSNNSSIHPMLQQVIKSPLWQSDLYQGQISCQQLPFLLDHKVFDQVVVAGACHLSALIAIARVQFNNRAFKIEQIAFIEALQLKQQDQYLLQIVLTPTAEKQYQVKSITLLDSQQTDYTEHMQAILTENNVKLNSLLTITEIKHQCSEAIDLDDFYQLLARHQVQLGESFCWFKRMYKGHHKAFAEIRALRQDERSFGVPPGIVDACFQLLGAAVPEQYTDTYIPIAVNQIQIAAEFSMSRLYCYAQLDDNDIGQQDVLNGQVTLFNQRGEVLIELSAISLRKVDQKMMQQVLNLDKNIYAFEWTQIANTPRFKPAVATEPWLVLGQELARNIARTDDWAQSLDLSKLTGFDNQSIKNVMLCLDATLSEATMAINSSQNILCVLEYLQKIIAQSDQHGVKFVVITQQARAVVEQDITDPAVELIAGLLRSYNHEYPLPPCRWLDLDRSITSENKFEQILQMESIETEISVRSGKLYAARLQGITLDQLEVNQTKTISWQGSYLITGGSGALAIQTAQWLAEKGVKKIILMSRKGLSVARLDKLADIQQQGVEVVEVKADVANVEQVKTVFAKFGAELGGIIHAAGVLSDGPVNNLSAKKMLEVLEPKAFGLFNLHQNSLSLKLECFITYSSVASLLGAPGQGNYAAANSFMDSLIYYRQQQGLPGLSINWGPWAGEGMAEIQLASELAYLGIAKLTAKQAFTFLDQALTQTQPQLAIFNVDWQKFKFNSSSLTQVLKPTKATKQILLAEQLSVLPQQQRHRFLRHYVIEQVAEVLGLSDSDQLASDSGFSELGMDSLMTLELRNRIQKAANQALPSTLAFKYPSIDELLVFLEAEVFLNLFSEQSAEAIEMEDSGKDEEDIAIMLERELMQLNDEIE